MGLYKYTQAEACGYPDKNYNVRRNKISRSKTLNHSCHLTT